MINAWYQSKWWLWLFFPLAVLFWSISTLRRIAYQKGWFASYRSKVPLIVVGNITVGGTGKTPFVITLVELLKSQGYQPAIVSRGYGAKDDSACPFPRYVNRLEEIALTGDEPKLIANRTGCPVIIDPNRSAAVRYAENLSGIDVIISDDGLQHYKMARDIEIVLVDGDRKFGNGFVLPMGPLRETTARLSSVDFTVINSGLVEKPIANLTPDYRLEFDHLFHIQSNEKLPIIEAINAEGKNPAKAVLVSGIGNPQRFESTVKKAGFTISKTFWFPDHHKFTAADFETILEEKSSEMIIMTEKDAVKCKSFAKANWYSLPISAILSKSLQESILNKLKTIKK